MTARQTWRDGSFATTFPLARRVGSQDCIEVGNPADTPPAILIAGVDGRCWDKLPPWGGLALGGQSPRMGLFGGGLALGGNGRFRLVGGGLALGGVGTFELLMPLPVVSVKREANVVVANTSTPLPGFDFDQIDDAGDGTTLYFTSFTNFVSVVPAGHAVYEWEAFVYFAPNSVPLATDYWELVLANGDPSGAATLVFDTATGGFVLNDWGAGIYAGTGSGYWAVCRLAGTIRLDNPVSTNFSLWFKSTVAGFVDVPLPMAGLAPPVYGISLCVKQISTPP